MTDVPATSSLGLPGFDGSEPPEVVQIYLEQIRGLTPDERLGVEALRRSLLES